ncbi:MAG TPA: hemerythrin domain-containing protein [Stellaceae bacterium]|nr:hemerythrin domain-containing protein [Stellaceae bacterium]
MIRPLPWNVGFAIGHPEIDAQHRHLVVLINDIIAAVERNALETLPERLNALATAAAGHFRAELAVMRELGHSLHHGMTEPRKTPRLLKALAEVAVDEHEAEHAALLNRLDGFRALPPHSLCERLREWFVDHAIKRDARLRAVFQAI